MSDPRRAFTPGGPGATGSAIERWALPLVEGHLIGRPATEDKKAQAAAEAIAQIAREQAQQRGYEAGMAKAQAEMQPRIAELDARIKKLDALLQFVARPLQELDAEVEKTLLQLTLAVGKQLARRELRVDPAQVIAIIRESLAELPSTAREIKVLLHPEDAAIVRERLTTPVSERAWNIVEDPTMSRGGCLVRSETSTIDARLDSRINTVIANALGDERAPGRESGEDESAHS